MELFQIQAVRSVKRWLNIDFKNRTSQLFRTSISERSVYTKNTTGTANQ